MAAISPNLERNIKLVRIAKWLEKYTDPIPQYSGVSSHEMAEKLLQEIEEVEIQIEEQWLIDEEIRFQEKQAAYQVEGKHAD